MGETTWGHSRRQVGLDWQSPHIFLECILPLPDSGEIPIGPTIPLHPVLLVSVGLRDGCVSQLRPRTGGVRSRARSLLGKVFHPQKEKKKKTRKKHFLLFH